MSLDAPDLFIFDSGTRHQSGERLTPHKLTVLALVHHFKQLCLQQDQVDDSTLDFEHSLTEREKRVFMVTLLNLLQSPDMDLKSLRQQIDPVLKPTILDAVYNLLQQIAETGVMPLNDFFVSVSTLLTTHDKDGVIRRESIVGIYIRRIELAYNEMSFSQVVDMFNRVRLYFEAGFPERLGLSEKTSWRNLKAFGLSESALALSMSQLGDYSPLESFNRQSSFSKKQAEYFIAQQAQILSHHEGKALPPDQLQHKLCDILSANPDLAEAHFLCYMNSLRVKEYCTALHNLYHYFDRKAGTPGDLASKKKNPTDEVAMSYAALNLASLQFRFGNKDECRAALKEAIRLAQENNDHVCLQHALVWLNLLGDNHSGVVQLERSIRKTIDLSLPNLTVLGLNFISRGLGMGTESPARVIYYLTQSNLINCMHSNYAMMCAGFSQRAAMWGYYGKRELCSLDSQIVLNLNTSIKGVYYNGEAVCLAMCNLAQLYADLGDYSAASEIVSQAKLRFPESSAYSELWQSCQQRILFNRAVYSRKLSEAEQILKNLSAVDQPEAKIRKPVLLREQGQTTEAFSCLDQLLTECDHQGAGYFADYRCRVLLEIAELYIATGNHSSAVTYVTDCIAHAKKHYLELCGALGITYLAFIQLHMGLPEQGMRLIESMLTRVLTNASAYDKARVLYVYVKCKVAAAHKSSAAAASKKAEIISALEMMRTVTGLFKSVEAHIREKDAHYYQALLYQELGNSQDRNRCAYQFKLLDQLYPTLSSASAILV